MKMIQNEALKIFQDNGRIIPHMIRENTEEAIKYNQENVEAFNIAVDCLMRDWIPVSERLPKANEFEDKVRKYYLVQNEYDDMLVAYYDGRYWNQIYTHSYIKDRIVAWMPLPAPYKE